MILYTTLIWNAKHFVSIALLEGICATLNLHIQALKQSRYKVGYLFEGCYFGTIMGSMKIAKIKCLQKIPVIQYFLFSISNWLEKEQVDGVARLIYFYEEN